MLIELESDFWYHVQDLTPPPLDGSKASAQFLAERFPNSTNKKQLKLPDSAAQLIKEYDTACEQLEVLTDQKQKAENQLKQMLGDHESASAGNHIITWKSISQERLDSKTLKAEHPTLYKKYSNQTSYRRFSIKAAV
jgi:predicted phage-related endonuclease